MKRAIQIDERDNVATVTSDVRAGGVVEVLSPEARVIGRPRVSKDVPFGHKIALTGLERGEEIIKYGEAIGVATVSIEEGAWVHTHNVESVRVPTSRLREGGR